MIFKTIIRRFCSFGSNELRCNENIVFIDKLFNRNSKQISIFKETVKTRELKFLEKLFTTNGYQLRMTGGAVRDLLSGLPPKDFDLATNATPDQMNNIIRNEANIWVLKFSSGHRNGTVFTRVYDKHNYEITSLHKWTDERPGKPIFLNDWRLDALVRDFTINAMYLSFDGQLFDYVGGLNDLNNNVIRFVAGAESPIRQNVITIFRYFRFHCLYSPNAGHESQVLTTIRDNLPVLRQTSGQRIWTEMKKILVLKDCKHVINIMFSELEMGSYLGFTSAPNLIEFNEVVDRLVSGVLSRYITDWDPCTLFAALIHSETDLKTVSKRLEISTQEKRLISDIIKNRKIFPQKDITDLRLQMVLAAEDRQHILKKSFTECFNYCGLFMQSYIISNQDLPKFPFTGHLFFGRVNKKTLLSQTLIDLKTFWFKRHFKCTQNELEVELERLLQLKELKKE
ncbi:CCA tRNA nucleotidyltransferase 1, mitochondrial-like [Oppia nitens]|uniref:CCA tRNA nucleotidyltransferase 1, mitochondrial-like n=1 Tax=Oppia nitens TaxID=1686743 RepID=UPI0023DB03E3|nr:CCA tRNA nucleotidyltransferase 1, mitochondrial-like [Oppia nitens]